jgi:glucosamine-6-phosphate deaminase
MKEEKGEELVDIEENGNIKKEPKEEENKPKKNNLKIILIMSIIILAIIIFAIYYIKKTYKKMHHIDHIELIITDNYEEMSKKAADIISDLIKRKPNAKLGLATGSTPLGLYKELIQRNKDNEISFKEITTFNLDEYCGIPSNHEQSYSSFMLNHLFKYIDIDPKNTYIPKGEGDIQNNIKNYEEILSKNEIDLQLLGLGRNGHIGFNEPGTDFELGVHEVQLDEKTILDNARFFDNDISKVPKKAITMGIKNILDAETIILMANGENKADAIKNVMRNKVDVNIPVTALNLHKGKVYVIIDKKAASKL